MKNTEKPAAEKLGWRVRNTNRIHRSKTFKLRRDEVQIKEKIIAYEYEERADAVIIVPVTSSGEVILIEQYRYPVDAWCLETPAGGCHDIGDASLEEVVRKELREEIGATAGALEEMGWFFSAPSFADEKAWIFLAWDAVLAERPKTEQTEAIRTRVLPFQDALAKARNGEIATAPCALALFRCEAAIAARFR